MMTEPTNRAVFNEIPLLLLGTQHWEAGDLFFKEVIPSQFTTMLVLKG